MKREPKEKAEKVDLLKPYTPSKPQDDGCFGNMWDPQHKDCSICADIEVCGILYQQNHIQIKKQKFEEENGPTLDMTDFEAISIEKVEKLALQYQNDQEPMTVDELISYIKTQARTKDTVAVREYLKRVLPMTKMHIQEDEIHVQSNNNSRSGN